MSSCSARRELASREPSGTTPGRYLPVSRPFASGKYGMYANPSCSATGSASCSSARSNRFSSFCTLTKRAAPSFTAAEASRSWAPEKFEQPISRTFPSRTRPSRAPSVSAIGVAGSGSWS